ncbi:DNA polymerase phi-domain-containing protein [Lophiotrema nucula]|uniref:DNA polymerase phi-domain-containing protein n=1 Tax=Lophiotrema nucula TaxID=690887 RepID=A0A6A5ZAP6_9PLEO|nr:DNA polymerase phi-domain-containing protein [Lophiotrema nucula]
MSKKALKRARDTSDANATSEGPAKRQRQANKDNVNLSKLYDDLAAESDEVRLNAAKELILKLSPSNEPSLTTIQTALDRLIRGLCSQRKAARFGFCITLTELLRQLFSREKPEVHGPDLSVERIIGLVEEKTKVNSNVPGQERRDHLIGKLFGCKAVLQSSILTEPKFVPDSWNKILDHIYELARDVPWLREECGLIICEAASGLDERPESEECAQAMIERLSTFKLTKMPEGVALWLTVKSKNSKILPEQPWHKKDPLARKHRGELARILKESFHNTPDAQDQGGVKSAAARSNPPFTWDVVLSEILARDERSRKQQDNLAKLEFPQFWVDIVDSNLFATTSSHERKGWGFKLFTKLVTTIPTWAIPFLFSPNLMRTLTNQSKKDDRFLHAAALASMKAIEHRAEQEPSSAAAIVVAMTSKHSAIDLDTKQKAKSLEAVLLSADDEALQQIVSHFRSLILRPESEDQGVADRRRQTIADTLLSVVRDYKRYATSAAASGKESKWLQAVLKLLVETAYFVPSPIAKTKRVPLPSISDASRQIFRDRLSSCLTRLLRLGTASRSTYAVKVVGMIRSVAATSKDVELAFRADESVSTTIDHAFQTIDAIAAKGSIGGNKSAADGFMLLYSLVLLQVYDGDGDAVLMLYDLDASRKALLKKKKSATEANHDPFVEIILSFLGNPRTLFRRIAEETFTMFIDGITSEGLRSLTDILDTEENLAGQQELFAQGDDQADMGGSDNGDDDVEEISDAEMIDGASDEDADEGGSEQSSSADSDDEDSDEGGSSEDEEVAQFENLLAQTLQTSKPRLDGDGSDDSSDDSDMDDEQMMALDPHLTKIFQQRSKVSKKKQNAEAKQNVVQFKSKVLDLLTIYLDKEYSNPLTLEVILPMVRRMRANANKQLAEKTGKVLKTFFASRAHHKAALPKPEDDAEAWNVLKEIHEEVKLGDGSNLHATACSNASLHLAKVLVGMDMENCRKVVDIYAETQKQWLMDKLVNGVSAVQPVLFTQFHSWSVSVQKRKK